MLFGWEIAKSMYVRECMCKTWSVGLFWTRVDDSIFCVQCDMLHNSMDKEKKYHADNLFLDMIVWKTMHFDNSEALKMISNSWYLSKFQKTIKHLYDKMI